MSRARWLHCVILIAVGCGTAVAGPGSPAPAFAVEESDRLWTVGERAFEDRLYPLSSRMLERLTERFPTDRRLPEATLLLGKARLSQGASESALDAFKKAQGFSPQPGKPGEASFWEAETLLRLERFADARAGYERVLENTASPFSPDALYGLGWSNLQLKQREQSVTAFQRLLSAYPDHATVPSAALYLARELVELKRPGEALPLLRSFVAKYPGHRLLPDARYLLGQALLDTGENRDAVAEFRAFAAAYPSHELAPQARRIASEAVLRHGSKAELAEEYKALTTQSPPTAQGLYDAAVIASRLNRPRDAEAVWMRLRKEFPEHALAARASLELAQAAFTKKAYKDAASLAQAAAKSKEEPVRVEGLVLLGESELKLKRYAAAHQAFRSAAETPGQEPALHFRALAGSGLAQEELGQWAQAAKYYDEVAARSPDKTLKSWARERRAAIAPKLKPSPEGKPAPKSSSSPKVSPGGGSKP